MTTATVELPPPNALMRHATALAEGLLYGPTYALVHYWIQHPAPLDAALVWRDVHAKLPPLFDWLRRNYPPAWARRRLLANRMRQDHRLGIEEHYDVSNEFYKFFLDKKFMFYSCADFHQPNDTIEQAQTHKANFLLKLIDPHPGEKILELGCGWGSMLRHLSEATGDRANLLGYTLSRQQATFVDQELGLPVELRNFITCDYPRQAFDKIYSIGAWEHVRHADLDGLLAKLFAAIKPGGRLVQHFFCPLTEEIQTPILAAQLFFPGSFQPAYTTQLRAFERAGFRVSHQSIHDYRPTLRAWYDNLAANAERAIELVGVPTYNKYLIFFPVSARYFQECGAMLVRFVLDKPA